MQRAVNDSDTAEQDMMIIGVLATLQGPFQAVGEDGLRGVQLALAEFNHQVAGQSIELVVQPTNAMTSSAFEGTQKLINDQQVDVIIGPLSGDEADGVRDVARAYPKRVFINGSAGSQEIYTPTPNFFSFTPNGIQMAAGIGNYCYHAKGYRRMATIAEGYSFPFAQVGCFSLEFCRAGGEIVDMIWCGLGTSDFSEYIQHIPKAIDALFVVLTGTDGLNFVQQYSRVKGEVALVAGATYGDPSILHYSRNYADVLRGVACCGPVCDSLTDENWQRFAKSYRQTFPNSYYSPTLFSLFYYTNTKALLLALEKTGGGTDYLALSKVLASLEFETPTGRTKLDRHRTGITDNFINEIDVRPDGSLYARLLKRVSAVDSTLGYSDEEWLKLGKFGIRNMPCGKWSAWYNPFLRR
jgi:branched-chain amino acid transport system substrate-binding protein